MGKEWENDCRGEDTSLYGMGKGSGGDLMNIGMGRGRNGCVFFIVGGEGLLSCINEGRKWKLVVFVSERGEGYEKRGGCVSWLRRGGEAGEMVGVGEVGGWGG